SGESFSHWIYFWGNQCPLEKLQGSQLLINTSDTHCTEMASLLTPLIKNGTVPPLSVFTPDFAKKYGGANDKVLMMPGPSWYAQAVFQAALHIPAGQITAAMPLQWKNETPITTGQVGGGPWIISRHSTNLATAANFVEWATTVFNPPGANARPGYPAYAPLANSWLKTLAANPYFAADPTPALKAAASLIWSGWNLVTYPDQPVWSNTVVTQLVAGKPLSSPALTSAPVEATRPRGLHGAPVRGRRTGAGVSFILPYLPFLIGFGIAPMIYAVVLAFTTSSGGWAGAGNFTRTFKDYRFLPAFEHILLYTGVWLGTLIVFVVALALILHGRANGVSTGFRFLFYLPGALAGAAAVLVWLFMLDPAVSPFSFLEHNVFGVQ